MTRTILVTGAGGGLGGAMSEALVAAGYQVAAVDVDAKRLDELAVRANGNKGGLVPFVTDLSDKADCLELVPRVLKQCGDLFMVVNNAGVGMQVIDPEYSRNPQNFWDTDIDGWERVLNTNTRAPLILSQSAVKHFITKGTGRIVNVTTSFDTMISPRTWAYGQSKAALEAMTASLAGLLTDTPVRMNILVPGGPANTGLLPANTDLPRDKIIQPPVMGPPIVWLASDEAADFNNKRMVARLWDPLLPGLVAAEKASASAAWPGFGVQAAAPSG